MPRAERASTREPERSATGVTAPRAGAAPAAVLVMPGFGRWLGAAFVDVVLGLAVVTGALVGALAVRGVRVAWQPVVDFVHLDVVTGVTTLLVPPLLALVALQLASVLALGASIGQRLAGLRVARVFDGATPGPARLFARALAGSLGVLALGVGPLWGFWVDRRRRGLGDLVARTIVVRRSTSTLATERGDR